MEAEDSEDRLRGLIDRTRRVRAALAELREQAFAAAAAGADSGCGPGVAGPAWAAPSSVVAAPPAQMLPVLLLPPGLAHGARLAPGASMLSLGDSCGGDTGHTLLQFEPLLRPPEDGQIGQCIGERHASPKTSRPQLWNRSPARQPRSARREREEQHPPAAGASSSASFEEVLAALRAEGLVQLPEVELGERRGQLAHVSGSRPASRHSGSANGQRQAASGARRDSLRSLDGGSTPGRSQRPYHAPQQEQQQLQRVASGQAAAPPSFDPIEAERRLKAKLDQVHAAKRSKEAQAHSMGGSRGPTPRQQQAARVAPAGVPRLPLASLSHAGSSAGSRINSGRLGSSRENAWPATAAHAQQEVRPWQAHGSAPASYLAAAPQTASAALAMDDPPAAEPGLNFLPLTRDERGSCSARAGPAAGAGPPQPPRKESRISLPQLLSPAPSGCSAAPQSASSAAVPLTVAKSGSVEMRRSSFSVPDAASGAAAGSAAGAANTACRDVAKPAAVAVGREQAALSTAARALGAGAGVLPGEAGASPLQSTPLGPPAADGTPAAVRRTSRLGSDGAALGQLRSQLSGKLQSPPATPLEVVAQASSAVPGGPEGRLCCEESPGKVSTASSGSPEQQQQQQAAASPLRTFALPGDEEALQQGPAACTPTPRQHLDNIEQETPVQQQQHGSTGVPGGDRPAAGERSASSIGRKRANSEAGCSEGPASVKKRSPDVGSRGQLGPCSHAEQLAAGPAAAPVAAACTGVAACAASTKGQAEQEREQQEKLQGQQQQPAGLPEPAGAARPAQAAAPAAEGTRTASRRGPDSPTAGPGRLIIPVVLQHSPPQKRRQQQQHAAAHARAAGAADGEAQPTRQQAPPATKAAAAEIAGTLAAKPGQLDQREQQQQQEQEQGASAKPAAKTRAAAAGADVAGASMPSQQPAVAAVRVAPPPVSVPLADTVSPRQELPSLSEWVDACSDGLQQPKGRHQRPPGSEELEMPSTSVLIGGGRALQPMHSNNPAQHDRQQQQQQAAPPLAPAPPSATPGSGSAVPVAATAPPIGGAVADAPVITPRRRTTTLEPPETVLCLQEDAQGKQLLEAAPKLAGMPVGDLLAAAAQGCVVRKAWVRPNFKQGGSTRRIQLASGSDGRAEMLYPSGLLQRPLRFSVRRAVVPLSIWRPGQYIVLDTARGMLRLEPGSAADHARWVLALNAAFLASSALPASSSTGSPVEAGSSGAWRRMAVRDLTWSSAILLS